MFCIIQTFICSVNSSKFNVDYQLLVCYIYNYRRLKQ
nr:MAG TPA: hypothetical protein [Caudoviricetes sp.]